MSNAIATICWVRDHLHSLAVHPWCFSEAGHYAFQDTPSMPIQTPDGDVRANPAGFDRAAFLKELATALNQFFDRTLQ